MHRQDHRYGRFSEDRARDSSKPERSAMSGASQGERRGGQDWEDPLDFSDRGRHRSYADRLTEAWGGPNPGSGPEMEGRQELPPESDYARGHWGGGSYSQPGWGHSMQPGEGGGSAMSGRGMPGYGGGPAGRGMSAGYGSGQEQGFGHGFMGGQGFDQPSGHRHPSGGGGGDFMHQQSYGATGYGGQQGGQGMRERKGPKGYVRSDERIKDDVCERLYHLHEVDVSDVSVEVQNGTVTLEGHVPERWQKHRIEDVVEHCLGVRDIENRIRVQKGGSTDTQDAQASAPAAAQGRGKRQRH